MLNGVLAIDKPAGLSSANVVRQVSRHLKIRKIGHAGTLDPFATGVLLLCIGKGRKIVEYLMDCEKEYAAVIKLGSSTDTLDFTGSIVSKLPVGDIGLETARAAVGRFTGKITQTVPAYSALKVSGVPMYKLARQGVEFERRRRTVFIRSIELTGMTADTISINVTCSKGTYIRTLGEDIAVSLGTCGHLVSLIRKRVGQVAVGDALKLEQLLSLDITDDIPEIADRVIPVGRLLKDMPFVMLNGAACIRVSNGGKHISMNEMLGYDPCIDFYKCFRVLSSDGVLIATARYVLDEDRIDVVKRSDICIMPEETERFKVLKVFV